MAPRKYIKNIADAYTRIFGQSPCAKYHSLFEKSDHPEIDISELLDQQGIEYYQSIIGMLQWTVSLGRLDLNTAVMTMSGFRESAQRGHLLCTRIIIGYLVKIKHGTI